MNSKILFTVLIAILFLAVSCEKQTLQKDTLIDVETLALLDDEVLADINFAELLDEGDDGVFWGDFGFSGLKSAESDNHCWSKKVKVEEGNKVVITLEFNGNCDKSGTIIIEYMKPDGNKTERKKSITYIDFTNKRGVTFNGTKTIVRGNGNYNIKAEITITKENENEDGEIEEVKFVRNYQRQIKWICGLDTRRNHDDNIKEVTGQSEVFKYIDDVEVKSYSRKILNPLLIVKACALKIQAGTVKIEKGDGTELEINYGKMPEEISCDDDFDCGFDIEITKDGETFIVTFDEDGKRVKQENEG